MSASPETFCSSHDDEIVLSEDVTFSPLAQEGNIDWLLGHHAISGETFVLLRVMKSQYLRSRSCSKTNLLFVAGSRIRGHLSHRNRRIIRVVMP